MVQAINGYSDWLAFRLQNTFLGTGTEWVSQTTLYVGLYNEVPLSTGGTSDEVNVAEYVRQPMDTTDWNVSDTIPDTTNYAKFSNKSSIEFATAQNPWGTIKGFGIFNTPTKDTQYLLIGGAVTISKDIDVGSRASFKGLSEPPGGDLVIVSINQ